MSYICPRCGQQYDTTACPPYVPFTWEWHQQQMKGWICPRYNAGVSPYEAVCPNCSPDLFPTSKRDHTL